MGFLLMQTDCTYIRCLDGLKRPANVTRCRLSRQVHSSNAAKHSGVYTAKNGLTFFIKTVPNKELCDETTAVSSLLQFQPKHFSLLSVTDFERKWILMRNYGKILSWGECASDKGLVRKVLNAWVQVQKGSVLSINKLEDAGFPKRDAEWSIEKIEEMLQDDYFMAEHWNQMSMKHSHRFRSSDDYKKAYSGYVNRLCEKAGEYNVLLTIVHGDLNATNVIIEKNGPCLFIGYGLTSLSFPFIDAISFVELFNIEKKDLDFYLNHWESDEH